MRPWLCSVLFWAAFSAEAAVSDISRIYKSPVSLDAIEVCQGGGCAVSQVINLKAEEWQKVASVFAMNPDENLTPELERKKIAIGIGLLEGLVGTKTGTSGDRAGTFDNEDFPGQLDCNDEAINTTTYIRLMQQQGLLKWHVVEDMRTRNFFFNGWPHTTAVIHEHPSGKRFAVDSWFYDNGMPAAIVPFETWKAGYLPDDSPINRRD
jgi:hypothetical protein